MNKTNSMKKFLLLALLSIAAPALAKDDAQAVTKLDPAAFLATKTTIEKEIYTEDRYKELSDEDRKRVLDALDRMADTLDGATSVQSLSADDRAQLITDQTLVNTVLTQAAEDSRLICTREQKVGTRFKTTVCETVATRRERNEAARRALDNKARSNMAPLPGG